MPNIKPDFNTFNTNAKNFWGVPNEPQLEEFEEQIDEYWKEDTNFAFDDWNTDSKSQSSDHLVRDSKAIQTNNRQSYESLL